MEWTEEREARLFAEAGEVRARLIEIGYMPPDEPMLDAIAEIRRLRAELLRLLVSNGINNMERNRVAAVLEASR